jgi:hypothetical protein
MFKCSHGSEREHLVVMKYVLSRFRTFQDIVGRACRGPKIK